MTYDQISSRVWGLFAMPEQLEERVAYLEAEVARLKNKVEHNVPPKLWWEHITGAFADNSAYDEAMRLGREYRDSLHPSSLEPINFWLIR